MAASNARCSVHVVITSRGQFDESGATTLATLSFMDLALREARAAGDADEVPVGCVIVRAGKVVAQTGNRTLTDRDPTAHAEMVAIRRAAVTLGSERLVDCDLHVTLEPCAMCAAAISLARVPSISRRSPL